MARILAAVLMFATCAGPAAPIAWSSRLTQKTARQSDESPPQSLDETLKWLGTVIEGNAIEVGKRLSTHDSYKYEAFDADGCLLSWRETRESFRGQERLFKTIEDLRFPLASLSRGSIRVDKVRVSVYLVSFTVLGMKSSITSRLRSIYQDGTEDQTTSSQTGYGIYLQNGEVAQRVAKALAFSIRSCQQKEHPE